MSAPMRILNKLGPYIFIVLMVGVVVAVAALFFCWSTGLVALKTTAESPTPSPAATQSQPVTTPEEAQVAAGAPPVEEYTPPAPITPAEPTQAADDYTDGSYFEGEHALVESLEVFDDDIAITLKTAYDANATQTHAPYVLQEAIDRLTGTEVAAEIDLVAVYSSDGVLICTDRIPGGKWS